MHYVVLDLEWNMPESKYRFIKEPFYFSGEIIQIGAVKLNEQLEEISTFNTIVCPRFYTRMNQRVKELTSITNEDIHNGKPFEEAIDDFRSWCAGDSILLTWGPNDIQMLEDNLEIYGLERDWIPENFDAQLMFDDLETMENRQFSLDYAVYYFKIKGNTAHDALNDAIDTAAVIRRMPVAEWIEEERSYRLELEAEAQKRNLQGEQQSC